MRPPVRTVTIHAVSEGTCSRPRCEQPATTVVVLDDDKRMTVCRDHWWGVFEAAYMLTMSRPPRTFPNPYPQP